LLLAAIHCAVFMLYPGYVLSSINDRLAWFGVNAYPWWPLYKLGLPVSYRTVLIRPNPLGWAWCVFVWITFYYSLSRLLVWNLSRNRIQANGSTS
jgi:hypothetical protein